MGGKNLVLARTGVTPVPGNMLLRSKLSMPATTLWSFKPAETHIYMYICTIIYIYIYILCMYVSCKRKHAGPPKPVGVETLKGPIGKKLELQKTGVSNKAQRLTPSACLWAPAIVRVRLLRFRKQFGAFALGFDWPFGSLCLGVHARSPVFNITRKLLCKDANKPRIAGKGPKGSINCATFATGLHFTRVNSLDCIGRGLPNDFAASGAFRRPSKASTVRFHIGQKGELRNFDLGEIHTSGKESPFRGAEHPMSTQELPEQQDRHPFKVWVGNPCKSNLGASGP